MALVPVDYDPFGDDDGPPNPLAADTPSPALPDQTPWYGRLWDVAKGAGGAIAGDIGDLASGVAQTAAIPGDVYAGRIAAGSPEAEEAARQFAGTFGLGGAPGGAVASGISRRTLGAPIDEALATQDLGAQLRDLHLARGDEALPLIGRPGKQRVQPPPGVTTMDDFNNLVDAYAGRGQQAYDANPEGKYWYERSAGDILGHAGEPETATRFAGGLGITSPQTPVPQNLAWAIRAHNQAMLGMPIDPGIFPRQTQSLEGMYYGGEPVTGEKIGPFRTGMAEEWDPTIGDHSFVNDIWNMRALGYPDPKTGGLYSSSPTVGEHNFARIVANAALDRLPDVDLPKQLQALVWGHIKAQVEGTSIPQAAKDFSDYLRQNYGQLSWESAPGETTNHLPEYASAPLEQQQEFHNAIRGALTDDEGRDIIARHFGLLTGPTMDAPGVYGGAVSPGSQTMVAMGPMRGGAVATGGGAVDPASRMLAETAERVRGLLLRQDGVAWHKPFFAGTSPEVENLAHFNLYDANGNPRAPSAAEALAATEAMNRSAEALGANPGSYSAISTPSGFRFINDPDWNGLSHPTFQDAVKDINDPRLPDLRAIRGHADGFHERNDWTENPNGQSYLVGIGATGSPDLQRRAAELLAFLGPRVSQVEESFAQRYGWTPNRATRVWETNPAIQRYGGGAVVPAPPKPWLQRPAPPGSGPSLFPTGRLVPVDYDPFAGEGAR